MLRKTTELLLILLLFSGVGCKGPDTDPDPPPPPPPPVVDEEDEYDEEVLSLLTLHNQARSEAGVSPLALDKQCQAAAEKHAAWMASNSKMSHTGQGRSQVGDRLRDEDYSWTRVGENIAFGYDTPSAVVGGWMRSRGHRRNILSSSYKHVGLAVSDIGSRRYWCAVFASGDGLPTGDDPEISQPPGIENTQTAVD